MSDQCPCGCPADRHMETFGCPCGLPDEAPCAEPRHEDWCCANGCAGPGFCGGCAGTEADCRCLVSTVRRYIRKALRDAAYEAEWKYRRGTFRCGAGEHTARLHPVGDWLRERAEDWG